MRSSHITGPTVGFVRDADIYRSHTGQYMVETWAVGSPEFYQHPFMGSYSDCLVWLEQNQYIFRDEEAARTASWRLTNWR